MAEAQTAPYKVDLNSDLVSSRHSLSLNEGRVDSLASLFALFLNGLGGATASRQVALTRYLLAQKQDPGRPA
jgi:hypothetical protein